MAKVSGGREGIPTLCLKPLSGRNDNSQQNVLVTNQTIRAFQDPAREEERMWKRKLRSPKSMLREKAKESEITGAALLFSNYLTN